MKVEIQSYSKNQSTGEHHWKCLETWTLDPHGRAVCDDAVEQKLIEERGIIGIRPGQTYYPADGKEFLLSLPIEYGNCSYVRAVLLE